MSKLDPQRLRSLEDAIDAPIVHEVVDQVTLAMPAGIARLLEIADRPDAAAPIIAVASEEPALGAKVLHLVNTAAFGRTRKVGSIEEVVALVKPESLGSLVVGAGVLQTLQTLATPGVSIEIFQANAIRVADLARSFAPPELAEAAWTAGLLHDVGKLALATCHPTWASMARRAVWEDCSLEALEREALGTTHAEIGAALLARWGLPFEIVEAIAFHHRPDEASDAACPLLAIVHAADALYGIARCAEPRSQLDLELLARAHSLAQLPAWSRIASDRFS